MTDVLLHGVESAAVAVLASAQTQQGGAPVVNTVDQAGQDE